MGTAVIQHILYQNRAKIFPTDTLWYKTEQKDRLRLGNREYIITFANQARWVFAKEI
jgi:hypothetical protein